MTDETWEIHRKNFTTMLRAADDHRRFCLGRARSRTDPKEEVAVLIVVNYEGDDVLMIPIGTMLDDPEAFMDRYEMMGDR